MIPDERKQILELLNEKGIYLSKNSHRNYVISLPPRSDAILLYLKKKDLY